MDLRPMIETKLKDVLDHLMKMSAQHTTTMGDLQSVVIIQNALLMAMIRSHPNKAVLETNFETAIEQFAKDHGSASEGSVMSTATLTGLRTAFTKPLG
jgi:hypothetical protein